MHSESARSAHRIMLAHSSHLVDVNSQHEQCNSQGLAPPTLQSPSINLTDQNLPPMTQYTHTYLQEGPLPWS